MRNEIPRPSVYSACIVRMPSLTELEEAFELLKEEPLLSYDLLLTKVSHCLCWRAVI